MFMIRGINGAGVLKMNLLRFTGVLTAISLMGVLAPLLPFFIYSPVLQKYLHRRIGQSEYRKLYSELVQGQKVACYQCGGTEQEDDSVHLSRLLICTRCKTPLWKGKNQ
jgi:hypothetical protein